MPLDSKTIIEKRAGEKIFVGMDFGSWLSSGEELSSITSVTGVTEGGSDLMITSSAVSGTLVQFFIEGGTEGSRYPLTVTVVTSLGQTFIGEGPLKVVP